MGSAPSEYTIQHVIEENKVTFEGESQVFDVLPKGQQLAAGQELRGWLNPDGKHGPYFKTAEDRAPSSNGSAPARSGGRDDATGRSIERQVALKAANDLAVAGRITHDAVTEKASEYDTFLAASARSGGSPPPAAPPAADSAGAPEGSGQGAAQPVADGADIPF